MKERKENRFVRTFRQGKLGGVWEIWVDTETGVNYLYHMNGYSGGVTMLRDAEGKPVITLKNGRNGSGQME